MFRVVLRPGDRVRIEKRFKQPRGFFGRRPWEWPVGRLTYVNRDDLQPLVTQFLTDGEPHLPVELTLLRAQRSRRRATCSR